ncbi:MAG: amidase [Deltaproteobacteria bacterium]|nr:amidase [Deltaproteobacteria bacterium]
MDSKDYAYATATETVVALRRRETSSLELTDAAIARIERLDGVLNAVVVRDFERAREAAKAADAARACGDDGALLGVPITVKESFDLVGHPTTWGYEPFREHRATEDAVAVKRLKAAGAVLLGKTNVPVGLADWQSFNPLYGRTVNPWDNERSAGGSSGGSAVALSAGYVPLEMGSDIGGSVRVPAAFNGIYGHKPSWGIVSMRGHLPGGFAGAPPQLAVAGPLARSAEDLDLALGIVAGPDGDEATAWKLALPAPRCTTLKGARVLVLDRHPRATTSNAMRSAIGRLAEELASGGAAVSRESSLLPDLAAQDDLYFPMLITIVTRGQPGAQPPSAHEWMGFLDAQTRFRKQWAILFESFDVVVAPTFGRTAYPHDESANLDTSTIDVDGEETPYRSHLSWPAVAIVPNLPATAFPIGFDAGGLPLGAQAIGAFGEDRTTIAFARLAGKPFTPPSLG